MGRPGLGAGLPTREQSGGRGGGGCSQPKRSETGLIGRRWSCGGRKGEGITCRSAVHRGRAVRRGEGMGVQEPGAWGRVCRPTELDPQRYRAGGAGAWGSEQTQNSGRAQQGPWGRVKRNRETIPSLVHSPSQGDEAAFRSDRWQLVSPLCH